MYEMVVSLKTISLAAVFVMAATRVLNAAPRVKSGTCNILALSGGGAFGAVEMGILDGLTNSGQAPNVYDIVTGISAGGLNAGFLSYYNNVSQALPDIYSILASLTTKDVYESAILNILSDWSVYTTTTLDSILSQKIPAPPVQLVLLEFLVTQQTRVRQVILVQ